MKRIITLLIVLVTIFGLTACGDSTKHEGEAKTPSGSSAQKGRGYQDVVGNFKEKGFTNIKTEALEDLITGWTTKDGEVESVSVDGNKDYSADVWYPNDIKVVITYHTFPKEKTEDTSKKTEDTKQTAKKQDTDGAKVEGAGTGETKDKNLTVDNCDDFVNLLKVNDSDDPSLKEFVNKYKGKTIEFDGNISAINNHGDYKTRYDILILAGDYSKTRAVGPNFQFSNVGVHDLGLSGMYLPEFVKEGNNIHVVAKVREYNEDQGLLMLTPISIETR